MKVSAMFLTGLLAASLHADTLQLRNGERINGTFQGGTQNAIRFKPDRGAVRSYMIRDVEAVYLGSNSNQGSYSGSSDRSGTQSGRSYDRQASTSVRAANDNIIPAGTVITVRTIDRIDTDVAQVGQTFRGSLDDPIVVNGRTIAPAGADATLRVVRVEQGGKITGNDEISLELGSVRGYNRTLTMQTENAEVAAKSRGQQSATVIGGTAAIGAIIGAIAGGGKGAAIGAATGAGAGAAIQAVRGQHLKIEPESKLDFTVSRDVYIQ